MKCVSRENIVAETWVKLSKIKMPAAEFNLAFPIVGYWVYSGGIQIVRECAIDSLKDLRTGRRQRVTALSPRSLHRLAFLAMSTPIQWKSLLTLTYGQNFPLDGDKVKYHLNFMLTKLERRYGKFEYLWFLEFQKRSAPHFHILTTLAPPKKAQRLKFAEMWSNIIETQNWPYERIVWADGQACYFGELKTNDAVREVHANQKQWAKIKKENGARRYMVKYATKLKQKIVPRSYRNVGRFWGKAKG